MYERAIKAYYIRDKISRMYYACYHMAIACIYTKDDFSKLAQEERTTTHKALQLIYPRFFSKTKKSGIVPNLNAGRRFSDWCNLRNVADYEIVGEHFEPLEVEAMQKELDLMSKFYETSLFWLQQQKINMT